MKGWPDFFRSCRARKEERLGDRELEEMFRQVQERTVAGTVPGRKIAGESITFRQGAFSMR